LHWDNFSSRQIEQAMFEDVSFPFLSGDLCARRERLLNRGERMVVPWLGEWALVKVDWPTMGRRQNRVVAKGVLPLYASFGARTIIRSNIMAMWSGTLTEHQKKRSLAGTGKWMTVMMLIGLFISLSHAAQPHVLLIMVDDLGWMDLRCQGNERIQSDRIDTLGKQGVRFTNAYAASPVCSPTRGALITGLSPARLHITQHGRDHAGFWPANRTIQPPTAKHVLPLAATTLAERLKAVGYATGFFGKWHLSGDNDTNNPPLSGPAFWPEHQGFDVNIGGCGLGGPPTYFDPYRIPAMKSRTPGEYLTDRLADEAIAFMQKNSDKPMYINLWTYNVHYPYEAPADLVKKYAGKEGPGLKRAVYGAQVEATDRAIGKVLDALEQLGIANNTLVIFTSDNGGWEGATDNHPLKLGKGDLYEGGLRVPLIIRWPSTLEHAGTIGTTNETPVVTMDLTATILDAAKAPLAENELLDGVSLLPLLRGESLARDFLYFHYPHFAFHKKNRPGGAIRSGPYKLIRRYDDNSVELFNVTEDLSEQKNLATQNPQLAKKLDQQLGIWLVETKAQLPTVIK
jgi:arylsulfatase A